MKKVISGILFSSLFVGLLLAGSCNNVRTKQQENPNECTKYSCPMHPDHTSTIPAKCPECNMDMKPVANTEHKDSSSAK